MATLLVNGSIRMLLKFRFILLMLFERVSLINAFGFGAILKNKLTHIGHKKVR